MKKIICLFLIYCGITLNSNAQIPFPDMIINNQTFSTGVHNIYNSTSIISPDDVTKPVLVTNNVIVEYKAGNYNYPKDSTKQKKWHWGIYFSGEYNNWIIKPHKDINSFDKEVFTDLDTSVLSNKGFSVGFTIERQIWENLYLQSGLILRDFNLKSKSRKSWEQGGGWSHFHKTYNSVYLTVPVNIKYYFFSKNKFSIVPTIGVAPCFQIYGKINWIGEDTYHGIGKNFYQESFHVPFIEGNASLAISRNFDKIKISLAPFISYTIKHITLGYLMISDSVDEYIYSAGVGINLIF